MKIQKCPYCGKKLNFLEFYLEISTGVGRNGVLSTFLSEFNCSACGKTIVVKNNNEATKQTARKFLPVFPLPVCAWILMRYLFHPEVSLTGLFLTVVVALVICMTLFDMLCRYFGSDLERKTPQL